ncbi:MAG: hypothetical protein J6L75_01580 [Alistipes sp.]|nr:hypothetical protein [Alistipes sp.]
MKGLMLLVMALFVYIMPASAQKEQEDKYAAVELPHKIENIEIEDARGNPAKFPYWGEKNLLIFYVDPDRHSQNHEFTVDMEENKYAAGDNIYGLGVLNLRDTWLPNSIVRNLARKRTEKNGALILSDIDRSLAQKWGLGDCNNKFVLLIISKEGELVFCRKGEFSEQDKKEFIETVQQYR